MLALILDDDGTRLAEDWAEPKRPPGEALIAVRTAGVCDTDLQLARGYMGYRGVLGHEFVGEVLEADDKTWVGRRVVADINAGCGACDECRERASHHCAARTVLGILGRGGALGERLVVPERNLVAVPDAVDDDRAVFAEPLAAALHVLDAVSAMPARAIVIGDGKLGLLIAMALVAAEVETTLIGRHASKLALAHGARTVLESDAGDATAPLVVEATGTASGLDAALRRCEPRGTVVLKTTTASAHEIDLAPVVINEIAIVGSRCGNLAAAIDWMRDDRIDPRPLIAARYPMTRADRALSHAGEKGVLKVLVDAT